jgi:thymidylate synthase (FAD)
VKTRSDILVGYVRHCGTDADIARAAWVDRPDEPRDAGPGAVARVIRAMLAGRHGTPFEHGSLTVYVEAPIFVFREWHRHRIGWSYNETSARYRKFDPEFWLPPADRPLVEPPEFKPLAPRLRPIDAQGYSDLTRDMIDAYAVAEGRYQSMLARGVAREVARSVLPVGTYTAMHATCNPRSLMNFVGLRTSDPTAKFLSYPQAEIESAARQLESLLALHWPLTHAAFRFSGRVAP